MQVLEGKILFNSDPNKVAWFENSPCPVCQVNEDRRGIHEDIVARGSIYADDSFWQKPRLSSVAWGASTSLRRDPANLMEDFTKQDSIL